MASEEALASLGVGGASAAAHALSLPADAYGNDPRLEVMWAMKAYNHAEVYFNLISSVDPKFLKLTKLDDKIYSSFRETFKELDIKLLKPDDLKSDEAKEVGTTPHLSATSQSNTSLKTPVFTYSTKLDSFRGAM
ncbi:protein PBDC1 [Lycodopsis pacificus]